MKKLLAILILAVRCFAQSHTFPALDTNNTFTGANAFQSVNATQIIDSGLSAGIVCATSGGLLTTSGCSGGTGITGSGTQFHLMQWATSGTAGDTNFVISGNSITSTTGSAFILQAPNLSSGNGNAILIRSGTTSDAAGSGGSVTVATQNQTGSGGNTGSLVFSTGNTDQANKNSGDITLKTGDSNGASGSGSGGNIVLDFGSVSGHTGSGGMARCGDTTGTPGCNIEMVSPNQAGTVGFMTGHGVPSGNCQIPLSNPQIGSVPVLYLRDDPASASTFLYVCIPPNTWTAITVP